jgi:hypothetical protein
MMAALSQRIQMKKLLVFALVISAATLVSFAVIAQQVGQQGAPSQAGQGGPPRAPGGGGRGPGIDALVIEDRTGFEPIFDGTTLKNWDGNPDFWRVENGSIVGETTAEKQLKTNTFIIYRGSMPGDFELKVDLKMNSTNTGIQYRSIELPEVGKWILKGYQADMDFANQYTGLLYEERGRAFLAPRGQMVHIGADGKKKLIANLRNADELKAGIKQNDWNTYHIIARGNRLTHIINGQLFSEAIDDEVGKRSMGGLLGFQIHVGPPMKLELRNIHLKNL